MRHVFAHGSQSSGSLAREVVVFFEVISLKVWKLSLSKLFLASLVTACDGVTSP